MSKVLGYDFSLLLKTKDSDKYIPVAFEVTASLAYENATEGTATKEKQGAQATDYGTSSYTINTEYLHTGKTFDQPIADGELDLNAYKNTARISSSELQVRAIAKEKADFILTTNKVGDLEYSGKVLLTSFNIDAGTTGSASATFVLTGDGALGTKYIETAITPVAES